MAADYILRMIQQVAMMLASIMAKRERGDVGAAADEIEEKCLQTIGLPLGLVKQSTPEMVAELLAAGGALACPRAIMLAELLVQDAELSVERGDPPMAAISYRHAASLLNGAIDSLGPQDEEHYRAKLTDVAEKLRDLDGGLDV